MTLHAARRALCALSCALALTGATPASVVLVQEVPEPPPVGVDQAFDARARAIAYQLRCPVCLGNSIQDSPSELAGDMRDLVREQVAAGKSEAEIKEYFVGRYGEWVLLNPKAEGFNLVVWVLPFVLLVGGGVLVWMAVTKWTAAGARGRLEPDRSTGADEEYVRRIREEVAAKRQ